MLSQRSQPEFRTPRRGSGWNVQSLGHVDPGTLCALIQMSASPAEQQELKAFLTGDESALTERTRRQIEVRLQNLLGNEKHVVL